MERTEVLIIGGGPGGYVAAITAAQAGAKVKLVEARELGGVCVSRGCIPTKSMNTTAKLLNNLKHAEDLGLEVLGYRLNYQQVLARKNKIVERLSKGVAQLLVSRGVEIIEGWAKMENLNTVDVNCEGGLKRVIQADRVILASGSAPAVPNIEGLNKVGFITGDEALNLEELPGEMVILGGGAVGVELATIFHHFGVKVTIIEAMPHILPALDAEIALFLQSSLLQQGISISLNAQIDSVQNIGDKITIDCRSGKELYSVTTDKLVIAVGRKPNIQGFEGIGLNLKNGAIIVDEQMKTNIEGIYAIGDVTGPPYLAHVASAQGIVAAESCMGTKSKINYNAVPSAVFTIPETACVGLTEDAARKKVGNIKVGRFPLNANGRAVSSGETEGFVKVISDERFGEILGVHIVGSCAAEIIAAATVAIEGEMTVDGLARTIHAHPTISEAVMEAAHDAVRGAIHLPFKPKK